MAFPHPRGSTWEQFFWQTKLLFIDCTNTHYYDATGLKQSFRALPILSHLLTVYQRRLGWECMLNESLHVFPVPLLMHQWIWLAACKYVPVDFSPTNHQIFHFQCMPWAKVWFHRHLSNLHDLMYKFESSPPIVSLFLSEGNSEKFNFLVDFPPQTHLVLCT